MILYRNIPTREADGTWGYTRFPTDDDFRQFVKGLFKEPGKYDFDETSSAFNQHARHFMKHELYTDAPRMSLDYIDYWDSEREKCRKGAIFHGKNGQVWYLPRFYYHWINFLQIYNKQHKKFEFPDVRDVQYHMALYEMLAELFDKNIAVVKKRQIASSYFHIAKLYNRYLFEEGYVGKLFASDKKYINVANGSWKFLNQYHNFTNKNTEWACVNSPNKEFSWQQKAETKTADGRKVEIGTQATITGITLDKDPVSGVGGACDEAFYEEGGIAPEADVTYGYMKAAMAEGAITTGVFTIAGSVGALDQCKPLQKFVFKPDDHNFYAVDTDLIDENGTKGRTALFIPEQWGMPPFIDENGNSKVEEALMYLNDKFAKLKESASPEDYQLQVSQTPRNLKEAFAMRTVSLFPGQHTAMQIRRIEEKEYALEFVDLQRSIKNKIETVKCDRRPIDEFPIDPKMEDKRGVFVMHEPPEENAPPGTYVVIVDPVEIGKTDTSPSLAAALVYKMDLEVITEEEIEERISTGVENYQNAIVDNSVYWNGHEFVPSKQAPKREPIQIIKGKVTSHLEGGKMVGFWCGRYDDINDTNEYISMICELYNARALSENNKPSFINYMRSKKRQKYLITKDEMISDKEVSDTQKGHQPYGVTMTTKLWKTLLEYAVNSLSEVLWEDRDPKTGEITLIHYGVERITDIMLLKEMQLYYQGLNVDRIITYALLQGLIKSFQAAGRIKKKVTRTNDKLENPTKITTLKGGDRQIFNHIGRVGTLAMQKMNRSPFKNIR